MIYSTLEFSAAPFHYYLTFTSRLTLVRGDSATGKTYLYQLLEDLRLIDKYNAIKLFNYKSDDFHNGLAACRDKFIVIDNADTILNEEDKKFINFEKSNQYLLFLRNCDGLNVSGDSFTILKEKTTLLLFRKKWCCHEILMDGGSGSRSAFWQLANRYRPQGCDIYEDSYFKGN